ncbi:hypothetical protein Tco_0078978 [Tanacetum coccineum]
MATAIALGIYLAYFPYEEGSQYLAFILAILVPYWLLKEANENLGIANQNPNGNGNVVAARAEGNAIENNEAGIQLQAEVFDLMATTVDLDEIEEVNANCILMANLQQASTSNTQTDKAPVYDSDGPAENDNNVIFEVSSVEQSGGIVEQHPATPEETRALYDSLYNNLATEVEKVNSVNPKFVRDFQSLAKEADESLAKHKTLELEIKRLLRAVVSQDIMYIVQNNSIVDTSNLQTELERTKERFEKCIIKKENEYAKFWNDWYKKCEECKYDKFSYDKAYNDMQQKIERLQAQLGDQ